MIQRELLLHVPDQLAFLWKEIRRALQDNELMRFQRKGIDLLDVYSAATGICVDVHRPLRDSTLRRTNDNLARLIDEIRLQIAPVQSSDPLFSRLFATSALEPLLFLS